MSEWTGPEPGGGVRQQPGKDTLDPFRAARERLTRLWRDGGDTDHVLRQTVAILHQEVRHYHWVGIYLLDGDDLILHNFLGRPTPHERIPVGRGICGAAIRDNATVLVDDVHADPRYLACSLETASEIVVPIRSGGHPVGEIDIDSDTPAAFGPHDRTFLEKVAERLAGYLG